MQNAATRLRQAAEARQNGRKVDRDTVKKALTDIKGVIDSGAFRPEDQEAVNADLEALKEKIHSARGRRRFGRMGQ